MLIIPEKAIISRGTRKKRRQNYECSGNSSKWVNIDAQKTMSPLEHVKIGPDLLCVLGCGRRYLLCWMSNWKPALSRIRDSSMYPHPPLLLVHHYYLPPFLQAGMLMWVLGDTL